MNISFKDGKWVLSVDTDRRALGLGFSFYRGEAFLTLTIELPLALLTISYAR